MYLLMRVFVFIAASELFLWGPDQTSNVLCTEPNTFLDRPNDISSTVDSDVEDN